MFLVYYRKYLIQNMFHSNCYFMATGKHICTRSQRERFNDLETTPVSNTIRIPNTGLHNNLPTCATPRISSLHGNSLGNPNPLALNKNYPGRFFTEGTTGYGFHLSCQPTCQHTYYSFPQGCDETCKQLSGNPDARAVGSNKINTVTQCACEYPENKGCVLPAGFSSKV